MAGQNFLNILRSIILTLILLGNLWDKVALDTPLYAQTQIPLWKKSEVRFPSVTLTPFLSSAHSGGKDTAVIVCPGGSYSWLDWETEGECVARWLQSQGISAFVLRYRVQGVFSFLSRYRYIFRGRQYPDALQDLQQAILHVRRNASSYGLDSLKLGVMGFSAGGHLVVSAGTFCSKDSLQPDFIASIYPVVTFCQEDYVHKRSRRALLGEWRKFSQEWRDSLSLENHIHVDMPPVFLVNCLDDPIVHYRNSEILDSALTMRGVPHEYHQYKQGGHGFGADPAKAHAECIVWRDSFLKWLSSQKL